MKSINFSNHIITLIKVESSANKAAPVKIKQVSQSKNTMNFCGYKWVLVWPIFNRDDPSRGCTPRIPFGPIPR